MNSLRKKTILILFLKKLKDVKEIIVALYMLDDELATRVYVPLTSTN